MKYSFYLIFVSSILISCGERSTKTYYVSNDGNDQSTGSKNQPFRTLAQAASVLMPGNTVYIRGGEYYETLRINKSGTEILPILISGYPGEKVIIYGADMVATNWKKEAEYLWVNKLPEYITDFRDFQVFRGDKALVEARWPNMPGNADMSMIGEYGPCRAVAKAGTDKDGIVTEELFDGDIVGGGVCIWPGAHGVSAWSPRSRKIAGLNGNKLLFDEEMTSKSFSGMDPYTPYEGNAFFVFGSIALLDNENEYHVDERERKLYIFSKTDPNNDVIRLKKRTYGIYLDSVAHVTISGIDVLGASLSAQGLNNVTVEHCKFLYPEYIQYPGYGNIKQNGMIFRGQNSSFQHNEVGYCSSSGLSVQGSNLDILNNYIHDIACTGSGAGVYIDEGSEYMLLAHNSIIRSGRSHFLFRGGGFGQGKNMFNEKHFKPSMMKEIIMEHNYLQDHNTYTSDCALFYAWNVDGGGTKFSYNYCIETLDEEGNYKYTNGEMDRQVQGLYSDNFCKNMEFSSNIVINQTVGIQANTFNVNIQDFNNTIINPTDKIAGSFGYLETPGYMRGSRMYNNTFFTADTSRNFYFGIHCDKGSFEDPEEVCQVYTKYVTFDSGKAITRRYNWSGTSMDYTHVSTDADSTFEIIFDQHDPVLRNDESKGNRLYTDPGYGAPEFYNNYFKLPDGEILKDYGCDPEVRHNK